MRGKVSARVDDSPRTIKTALGKSHAHCGGAVTINSKKDEERQKAAGPQHRYEQVAGVSSAAALRCLKGSASNKSSQKKKIPANSNANL